MSPVRHDLRDGVLTLTLHRPERRNALNLEMLQALHHLLGEYAGDEQVRALWLRGSGGCFCAGADLRDLAAFGEGEVRRFHDLREEVFRRIEGFPAPTVAAVEGYALGTGLVLALTADFRLARADAALGIPSSQLGITESYPFLGRLVRLAGPARARYLVLGGERVSGREALALGLVEKAVDPGRFPEACEALARRLASHPPGAARRSKAVLAAWETDPTLRGVADPAGPLVESVLSEEGRRGTRGFASRSSGKRAGRQ
ncbi:MAG: enoyl-CoA hydratase-related protein [Deferrisomatales bacterium]